MSQEPLTLYKLIILHMLNRVDFPLTSAQVGNFILEKEYTNFLTLQQAISELTQAGLISARSEGNRTYLQITQEGKGTLSFFDNRISDTIKDEITTFLKENEIELINEISIRGDYYKATTGEYHAHLIVSEKNIPLVDITLSVPTAESASIICDNWQYKNEEIYQYLIQQLF
ncbi:MAG: DUF4364 family protein [Lachnospiraceae bacterium]|nr:DUF4364 family protein [Lachnospiraceae bacterium]